MAAKMHVKKAPVRLGFVYLIVNLINLKAYVGQTIKPDPRTRWQEHIHAALYGASHSYFHRALRKYGVENFSAEVIWVGPVSDLNNAERRFVRRHRTFVDADGGWGYNLTSGGGQGGVLSRATKRKVSKAVRKAYQADPTMSERIIASTAKRLKADPSINVRRGKSISAALKADPSINRRRSRSLKATHKADPSIRANVGLKMLGRKMSKEAKAKIAASHIGIRPGAATRRKMSRSAKRRFKDPAQRVIAGNGQRGKKHSAETKLKRANAIRATNAKRREERKAKSGT